MESSHLNKPAYRSKHEDVKHTHTHTHTPLHKHRGQARARCVAQETKLHSLQYPVMEKNPNTDMHACVTEPPGCTPGRYRLPCFSEGQASFFFFFFSFFKWKKIM